MLNYNTQKLINNIPRYSFRSTFTFSNSLKPLPILKNISKNSDMLWAILFFSISSNNLVIEQLFSCKINIENEKEVNFYD